MDKDTNVDPEDIAIAAPSEFSKDETEFNAFKLWKEQKERRKAGSRSFSIGKTINHLHKINLSFNQL